jgi:hypothetical protein
LLHLDWPTLHAAQSVSAAPHAQEATTSYTYDGFTQALAFLETIHSLEHTLEHTPAVPAVELTTDRHVRHVCVCVLQSCWRGYARRVRGHGA